MAVNINNDQQSSHPACAACRYQRKKCIPNCLLRRHFPASNSDGFAAVHKVFGVANVSKMMREAKSLADQDELARSLHWEAEEWAREPVRGPYGAFALLQDENRVLREQLNQQRMIILQNTPMLPPPPVNNNNSNNPINNFDRSMSAENYYVNQQMPMSFSAPVNRQFQGQRSMTKEDYDRLRVSGNGKQMPMSFSAPVNRQFHMTKEEVSGNGIQMPMSFSAPLNRQFHMTKEEVSGSAIGPESNVKVKSNNLSWQRNQPESNVRVTSNNLSWQRNQQQQQQYTSSQHDKVDIYCSS